MNLGQHMTDEQRAYQSNVHMGQPSGNRGHRLTDEQRARQSVVMREVANRPEVKAKNRVVHMGHASTGPKHQTLETRAKISAARLGFKASPETRAKMSAGRKVYWAAPEARAKLSASSFQKGKCGPLSPHWKGGAAVSGRKHTAIRRTFGFTPLNSWFPGCEAHHINHNDVIYLPRKLHHSVYHCQRTGKGMVEMNALAGQFLTEDWT